MKKIVLCGVIALVVLAARAERIELKTDWASCVVEAQDSRIMLFKLTDGEVAADCPLDVRSVSGLVFRDFSVTSGSCKKSPPAVNTSDGWEWTR